jgi:hypothetical protein
LELLKIWLENLPAERILGCAWELGEADEIGRVGATPMAVIQGAETDEDALQFLRTLPTGSYVYSHPQYTNRTLTPAAPEKARAEGVRPAGARVSKVDLDELHALKGRIGSRFRALRWTEPLPPTEPGRQGDRRRRRSSRRDPRRPTGPR